MSLPADDATRFRTIIDSIAEGIITMTEDGIIRDFNFAACHIFGYQPEEVIGKNITMLMPAEMRSRHDAGMTRYVATGRPRVVGNGVVELPGLHKQGHVFHLELAINEMRHHGVRSFAGIVRDISERKKAELELFTEKERLRVTLGSIGDAVITVTEENRITYINPVAESMSGWEAGQALGRSVHEIMALAEAPPSYIQVHQRSGGSSKRLVQLVQESGKTLTLEESSASMHDAQGAAVGKVYIFHDVSRASALAAELSYQATHDELTGLINRREFERRLELSLQNTAVPPPSHALIYLDMDQFKAVNDIGGHAAGDELLRQLSSLMTSHLRQSDSLARLAGDEFAVILHSCPLTHAQRIAESIRRAVSEFRFIWHDKIFPASMSIGLTTFTPGASTAMDVLRLADAACYVAKEKGRNRLHVHTAEDDELAHRSGQFGWIERVRHALDEERFVLHVQRMQPLHHAAHAGAHYELLVRMVNPDGSLVPPATFIPAAERYGMMTHIDRWVVKAAFALYARNAGSHGGGLTYAINLSATSICDEHFLEFVFQQFDLHGIAPHGICFEITETSAIANLPQATRFILRLKEIGCTFALDDFGSGMSSFAYLKQLPVDFLKIDGSMVKDLVDDPISYAMVEAITRVGHVMGVKTVAEFVETAAIFSALEEIGVDYAQGYAIERPRLLQAATPAAAPSYP